jgi:hypothetical protein
MKMRTAYFTFLLLQCFLTVLTFTIITPSDSTKEWMANGLKYCRRHYLIIVASPIPFLIIIGIGIRTIKIPNTELANVSLILICSILLRLLPKLILSIINHFVGNLIGHVLSFQVSLIANILSESLIVLSFCKLDNRYTVTSAISVPVGLILLLLNHAGVIFMLHEDKNLTSPSLTSSVYNFFVLPTVVFYFSIAVAWTNELVVNMAVYSKPKLVLMSYLLIILFIPSLTNLIVRVSNQLSAGSGLLFFSFIVHTLLAVVSFGVLGIMLLYFMKYHPHDFDDDYAERLPQTAQAEIGVAYDGCYNDDSVANASNHYGREELEHHVTSMSDDDDVDLNSINFDYDFEVIEK